MKIVKLLNLQNSPEFLVLFVVIKCGAYKIPLKKLSQSDVKLRYISAHLYLIIYLF